MSKAFVIPCDSAKACYFVDIPDNDGSLLTLQGIVGGYIEAIRCPVFVEDHLRSTIYINEEGKYTDACTFNSRATDFMVPGAGLFAGDYIAGNMILLGFDDETGENADVPPGLWQRAALIAAEAM